MALSAKVIKTKIKAVSNIKKITKAMEMVSAAKMRKATSRVVESKSYVMYAYELLLHMVEHKFKHELLLAGDKGDDVLIVAVASGKGLCGGFNVNMRKKVSALQREYGSKAKFIAVGKYMERAVLRSEGSLVASFTNIKDTIEERDIWSINDMILNEYRKGLYKKVVLVYTRFNSAVSYVVIAKDILPIAPDSLKETIEKDMGLKIAEKKEGFLNIALFEPGEDEVLDSVLPRITEVFVYQAFLESLASEHSSRMMAMRNASDNAGAIITDLTVGFNRARQANITKELAEISAGSLN